MLNGWLGEGKENRMEHDFQYISKHDPKVRAAYADLTKILRRTQDLAREKFTFQFYPVGSFGSTPILVDKGQKGRGTASCNLPATRYIIEANPLNVLKPRAFRFAACIMELIPSQTAFVMRW